MLKPIKEDLFTSLDELSKVRLKGTRCPLCGEVFLGKRLNCENCGHSDMEDIVLSNKGTLFTYTTIEHRPSGDYKGEEPFVPIGLGLVEMPEGLRIIAPLTENNPNKLKIGMALELVIHKFYRDEEGNDVISFKFKPV